MALHTLGNSVTHELRFQSQHRDRVPLMVSQGTMFLGSFLAAFNLYRIFASVSYDLIQQIRNVVLSLRIRKGYPYQLRVGFNSLKPSTRDPVFVLRYHIGSLGRSVLIRTTLGLVAHGALMHFRSTYDQSKNDQESISQYSAFVPAQKRADQSLNLDPYRCSSI